MTSVSPEIYEAQVRRFAMGKRVIPHFLRIGANAGNGAKVGLDTYSELKLNPNQTVNLTYQTGAKGYYRVLRILANAKTTDIYSANRKVSTNGIPSETQHFTTFWESDADFSWKRKKRATFLSSISASVKIGSSARELIGPDEHPDRNNDSYDGNLQDLCGNLIPGHTRIPYLLGPLDFMSLKLTNNNEQTVYLSGLIVGYRIVAQ